MDMESGLRRSRLEWTTSRLDTGWTDSNYAKLPLTLKTGNNVIDIVANNSGGPAGLLASLVKNSDKTVLLRTDSSWVSNPGHLLAKAK
jgi:hypothetical protein